DVCRRYVDRFNGDNLGEMDINGERVVLERLIPRASLVIDVGANVGDWSARARALNPSCTIHCFEPDLREPDRLDARGIAAPIHINRIAVGAIAEHRDLHRIGNISGLSSLYLRRGLGVYGLPDGVPAMAVDVTTLDAYCAARVIHKIDFLKID